MLDDQNLHLGKDRFQDLDLLPADGLVLGPPDQLDRKVEIGEFLVVNFGVQAHQVVGS